MIQEIVTARVPGEWSMDVDYSRFLLTFRPVTTSVVGVEPFEMPVGPTTANPLDKIESEIEEMEYEEMGPW